MDDTQAMQALRAVAHPVRWRVLRFLLDPEPSSCSQAGGVCGCDLEPLVQLSQPAVAYHMKQLVEAGLVRAEPRGRWTFYEIEPAGFRAVRAALEPFASSVDLEAAETAPRREAGARA